MSQNSAKLMVCLILVTTKQYNINSYRLFLSFKILYLVTVIHYRKAELSTLFKNPFPKYDSYYEILHLKKRRNYSVIKTKLP